MGILTDLIGKYPALSEVRELLAATEAKLTDLENENKKLRDEIALLKDGAAADDAKQRFTEAYGVLWKKRVTGGYEAVPCCPTCTSTLADYSGSLLCIKCNWQAPLKSFEVPKVFHDLFG